MNVLVCLTCVLASKFSNFHKFGTICAFSQFDADFWFIRVVSLSLEGMILYYWVKYLSDLVVS